MRGTTAAAAIAALAAAAAPVAAQSATSSAITCAESLYIIAARGSGEPIVAPQHNFPNSTGSAGYIAEQVAAQINGTSISGVIYKATDPTDPTNPLEFNVTAYYESENGGAASFESQITAYNAACPDGKIALIGYSQGAQLIQDGLCGGLPSPFSAEAPLPKSLIENNVIAIVLVADPSNVAGKSYNKGNSTRSGVFTRTNTTVCDAYSDLYGSWCEAGDFFCDSTNDTAGLVIHQYEPITYLTPIVDFVVGKWTNYTDGKSSTPSSTPSSTASGTGSASSSTSTNGAGGALAQMPQALLAGVSVVLAAWLLN